MTVPTVDRGLREVVFWSVRSPAKKPVDPVDVRLLHQAEELAGVRREGLDVAALALRVDRVEGEARLARTPERPVITIRELPWKLEVYVLEVVLRAPRMTMRSDRAMSSSVRATRLFPTGATWNRATSSR